MKMVKYARVALLAVALCTGAAAQAAVLSFTGSAAGSSIITTGGALTCSAGQSHTAVPAGLGTSSLGNFGYISEACVIPGGAVSGIYTINFSTADSFKGTLTGTADFTSTPGLFSPNFLYTVLSGTGIYSGASGTFMGTGSIDTRNPPPQLNLRFAGSINAPAVPEPGTWAMMLIGFGGVGYSMRRRRKTTAIAQLS